MNKAATFVWEVIGLILGLMGIIGMVDSASEFIYRREPHMDFMYQADFLAMINDENGEQLFEQIVILDMNYGMDMTPDKVLNGLTRFIDEYPDYIKGHYFRGQIYLSMGRVHDGITDMQAVIEKSEDPKLRRQARNEITLARLAQVLTPIPFLGLAGAALFLISNWVGIRVLSSWRSIKPLIVVSVIWVISFCFLLFH